MSEAKSPVPVEQARILRVTFPPANSAVKLLGYDPDIDGGTGTMTVRAVRTDARVNTAWVDAIPAGDALPPLKTATAVAITSPSGDQFEKTDFVVKDVPPAGPFAANKRLCYWGYEDDTYVERDSLVFAAVPSPCTVTVGAKQCLWLTYADGGSGPFGETPGDGSVYVPWGVRVPAGVTHARVELVGGSWRHGPDDSVATGPEGRPGTEQDLDATHAAGYRSATLKSLRIVSQPLRLNRLAALLEYTDHAAQDTTEIDAAAGAAFAVAGALRLRLGMHDGFEWSNNEGDVTVRVHWV